MQKIVVDADAKRTPSNGWVNVSSEDDGGFHITQIQEKNVGTRRMLLLGSFSFMVFALIFGGYLAPTSPCWPCSRYPGGPSPPLI